MYASSAEYYDALYAFKDYAAEGRRLAEWLGPGIRTVLDVACGTGRHAEELGRHFTVTGMDLDEVLVAEARKRLPQARFFVGDMRAFELGEKFDAITCLFSSIAYVQTFPALVETCACLAGHLLPGGRVLVEPWLRREVLRPGHVGLETGQGEGFKVARMSRLEVVGALSVLHFDYLIGTAEGVRHEQEQHRLALFTPDEYRRALEQAGFTVTYDEEGLTGRGLYLGTLTK